MHARIQQLVNACSAHDNVDGAVVELNRGYLDLFRELRAEVASQLTNTLSFDRTITALEEMAGELFESVVGVHAVPDVEPVTVFTGEGPFPDLETWLKHGYEEADYDKAKEHYEAEQKQASLSQAPPADNAPTEPELPTEPAHEPPVDAPTMLFDPTVPARTVEQPAPTNPALLNDVRPDELENKPTNEGEKQATPAEPNPLLEQPPSEVPSTEPAPQ